MTFVFIRPIWQARLCFKCAWSEEFSIPRTINLPGVYMICVKISWSELNFNLVKPLRTLIFAGFCSFYLTSICVWRVFVGFQSVHMKWTSLLGDVSAAEHRPPI